MALKKWSQLPVAVKRNRAKLYEYIRLELNGELETYYFDSFGDSSCTEYLDSGTVMATGNIEWDYTQVEVLTNNAHPEFVGKRYFVEKNPKTDGSKAYQLYLDDGTTGTGMYVKIYAEAPKRTVSITVNDGTDPVQGAKVVIGSEEKTTGSAGGCSFTLPDGKSSVSITKTGFTDKTQEITVSYSGTSFTISLTAASS